ncbi:diacylglycerol kinase family protein [Idiomarina sp. HP20-50]|uniref:diacylglycerol kinase family protein n=1 Tax=Idiomarina sp. HP20-50 TaxID=3070813 RepID=UPI00294B64E5|nr:diacylglycerol kinase family protein [Idiomarina sp. HP20-50]MDV6317028.1 diacylglycerol kinase family protein [Idiomarina sp. HP20-50]
MQVNHIPVYYLTGALVALFAAIVVPGWPVKLALVWCFVALAMVSSAYWMNMAGLFRKRQGGKIPWYIRWLLVPFLLGVSIYNWLARRRDNLPAWHEVASDLYVGRRLFASDVADLKAQGITAILDVTAEFDALDWASEDANVVYLNLPVLDHKAPSEHQIHEALQWIQNQHEQGRKVLVHCALGRGRSVFMVAAYMLTRTSQSELDQVMAAIQGERPVARLNSLQQRKLESFAENHKILLARKVWIVANPVSGGGKWREEKDAILEYLEPYFDVQVLETSPSKAGDVLAREALDQGAELVIAVGGDGTLTEVASVVKNTDAVMAIIPMGTANSLSQALWGVSSKISPVSAACTTIIEGRCDAIDVGIVNGEPMLLCVAVGFEQQMIEKASREAKNKLGQLAYLQGLWQACNDNDVLDLSVELDDKPSENWYTSSLIVANAAPTTTLLAQGRGNPMMDDGRLDLTWIDPKKSGEQHVFSLIELLYAGLTEDNLGINIGHTQASSVKIRRADGADLKYVVDGEPYSGSRLEISLEPRALKILIPEQAQY